MTKKIITPQELQDVATVRDVNDLTEKITKCYSSERYKEFQKDVEEIIGRYLKSVIGWGVFIWLITLVGSMFLQKIFNIF